MRLARFVFALSASLIGAMGCYWPVPTCDESTKVRTETVNSVDMEIRPDGSFTIDQGRDYASCAHFCSGLDGVENVVSCELPKLVDEGSFGKRWSISCTVDVIECREKHVGPKRVVEWH